MLFEFVETAPKSRAAEFANAALAMNVLAKGAQL